MLTFQYDKGLVGDFPFHHMAEHALSGIVIMAPGLVQPMPYLAWDHRGCDELGMGMLQTGTGIDAVVLEDGDVIDAGIDTQRVIAFLIDAKDAGHMRIGQHRNAGGVVRTVNNDFVKSEAIDATPPVLLVPGGLDFAGKCGELVGDDSYHPGLARIRRKPRDFRRGLALVARAEGAGFHKGWHRLRWPMGGQLLGALGAFGGDDDPLLGKEILAQLWHGSPPESSIGRRRAVLELGKPAASVGA